MVLGYLKSRNLGGGSPSATHCDNKHNVMGICKLVSENWTYMVSISHKIAFGMLLMIGRVIFDKTQFWPKKWRFHVKTITKVAAKFSELVRDRTKIFFANKYLGLEVLEGGSSNCLDA